MESNRFIDTVNKLQTILLGVGWDPILLPQVVLVGDQGCGKSSVMESLIGGAIIPKIRTTRQPLILQLIPLGQGSAKRVEFVHRPNKVFNDFEAVMNEIISETERSCGRNKGISTSPILMKLFSPGVINMTFVDLPGLARVRVGDQPPDIETTIKNTIMKYIKFQNSIILAVVAANTDIETSEILQMSRQVDPTGSRTICVVTKLDLMDAGTNATEVLKGHVINFKLGIVGVINRSQKDIDEGHTISDTLNKEKDFLGINYKDLADKHGNLSLTNKLHQLFLQSLKLKLPDLQEKIQEEIDSYNETKLFEKSLESQEELLCFLTKYVSAYSSSVSGTCKNIGTHELEGGARIGYIFQEVFTRALYCLDPLEGFDRGAILTALRNSSGIKPFLFVPQHCFEKLVKRQISNLIEPSIVCVRLVQDELLRMIFNCNKDLMYHINRFPKLRCKIFQVISNLVKSRLKETIEMVENLIEMHMSYINTAHPDFTSDIYRQFANKGSFGTALAKSNTLQIYSVKDEEGQDEVSIIVDSTPQECILIESMVHSYFNIIRKSVADAVPKIIMHFMVNYISEHLLTELVEAVYSDGDPSGLLEEANSTVEERRRVSEIVQSLKSSMIFINEVIKIR